MSDLPTSTVEVLREVVAYLDLGGRAINRLAEAMDQEPPVVGRGVQEDLTRLSDYLSERPDLDAVLFEAMGPLTVPD